MTRIPDITAVVLAGGRGRRMEGKDKGLVELNGQPLIQHVIAAIAPQVKHLVVNANRNLQQYADLGYPVVTDSLDGFQGPLAGFLAAMDFTDTPRILSVPCDGPLLPHNLVERLDHAQQDAADVIAVAHDGDRLQPVYSLVPCHLKHDLESYLASGERKIDRWYARHNVVHVDFSDVPEIFLNINTLLERDRLQQRQAIR